MFSDTVHRRSLAFAMIGAASLGLGACGEPQAAKTAKSEPARPVLVQTARYEPVVAERTFVATIKARIETDLGFRVAGKVAKRLVEAGDTVKAGQTLAMLDEVDLKLQLEQSRAELDAARGALTSAEAELARRTTLNAKGWTTQTALDQQRSVTADARGRVLKAERALALAENALGYANLVADADGVVTARVVEPGQVVAAGQPAIRVAQTQGREALAAIPEALVERVRTGAVSVVMWAAPDKTYHAHLRELTPAADAATRTYAARFEIDNAGPEVALGMTATVRIVEAGQAQKVVKLPLSALFNDGNGPGLWTVDRASGALALKRVEVARYDSAYVYVASGVGEGEEIVTLGVQKLDSGQKVRVVTELGR